MKKHLKILIIFCSVLLLTSCATFDSGHPSQIAGTKKAVMENNTTELKEIYTNDFKAHDNNIYLDALYKARIANFTNNTDESIVNYKEVIKAIDDRESGPKIKGKDIAQTTGSVATSDVEIDYIVPPYELTFIYPYQALNYVAKGDMNGALAMMKKLDTSVQKQARLMQQDNDAIIKEKEKEIAESQKKADKNLAQLSSNNKEDDSISLDKIKDSQSYKDTLEMAESVKSSYENAFGYYLSSLVFEASGNYSFADPSIKNAKRVVPFNKYVAQTFDEIQSRSLQSANKGRLVVLFEQNFVEPRSEQKFQILLPYAGYQAVKWPYYKDIITPKPVEVKISQNGATVDSKQTALLVDTNALAAKNLADDYRAIYTREFARLTTKTTAAIVSFVAASNVGGAYAGIGTMALTSAYNFLSSSADLRGWLLLPSDIQLYANMYPAGKYSLEVQGHKYNYDITNGKTTVLKITTAGEFNQLEKFVL